MNGKKTSVMALLVLFALSVGNIPATPQSILLAKKEIVYVPAYSEIFHGDLKWELTLAVTLSIHNIDMKRTIYIDTIDYCNATGKTVKSYINKKIALRPLETFNLGLKDGGMDNGVGGNFIVKWHAQTKVNRPIIETIMIGTKGQQGISFSSRGVAISE